MKHFQESQDIIALGCFSFSNIKWFHTFWTYLAILFSVISIFQINYPQSLRWGMSNSLNLETKSFQWLFRLLILFYCCWYHNTSDGSFLYNWGKPFVLQFYIFLYIFFYIFKWKNFLFYESKKNLITLWEGKQKDQFILLNYIMNPNLSSEGFLLI